jgi:hypothetical protein
MRKCSIDLIYTLTKTIKLRTMEWCLELTVKTRLSSLPKRKCLQERTDLRRRKSGMVFMGFIGGLIFMAQIL